jgi:hypothetical membrane protein
MTIKLKNKVKLSSALFIFTVQYFIIQLLVALDWKPTKYSFTKNTISDLGYRSCGLLDGRYTCSPMHELMNISFIFLGLSMLIGSIWFSKIEKNKFIKLGLYFMAISGFGGILVGLFPENSPQALHTTGATLALGFGCIGLVILAGFYKFKYGLLQYLSSILATISLVSAILFLTHTYLFFGDGGMEKMISYPQTLWLIGFGLYRLSHPASHSK